MNGCENEKLLKIERVGLSFGDLLFECFDVAKVDGN